MNFDEFEYLALILSPLVPAFCEKSVQRRGIRKAGREIEEISRDAWTKISAHSYSQALAHWKLCKLASKTD